MTQQDFPQDFAPGPQFDPYAAPRAKKSRAGCWILAIVLGVGATSLLVCCGGVFGIVGFGLNVVTTEVEDQLRDNPKLHERIGDVQSFKMDWTRSFGNQEDDTFVYQVQGSKGEGQVTVRHVTDDDGQEEILSATLRLSNGETVELVPE